MIVSRRTLLPLAIQFALALALPLNAGAAEQFTIKDKLATVRLLVLDGDTVTCTDYDARGLGSTRVVRLDADYEVEQPPSADKGPALHPDGSVQEETPLGRFLTTYRGGEAVERREISRHAADASQVRASLLALEGKPWIRQGLFPSTGVSDNGMVYRAYAQLGLFVPWTLKEQVLFGLPIDPSDARPGDVILLSTQRDETPDRAGVALGQGEALLGSARTGTFVRTALSAVRPAHIVGARRIIGTPYDGYMVRAPAALLALGTRAPVPSRPWRRMQGVCSFYGHPWSSEETDADSAEPPGPPPEPPGKHRYTAVHRSLPPGTVLRVRSLETGRSVDVTVEGTAQFDSDRSLEICYEAAQALGLDELGVGLVEMELLTKPSGPPLSPPPPSNVRACKQP